MSRSLSMIVAAGCIAMAPAFTAEARPDRTGTPDPVIQKTSDTRLDFSQLPPSAQRMLRDYFAQRQIQQANHRRRGSDNVRTSRTTRTFRSSQFHGSATPTLATSRRGQGSASPTFATSATTKRHVRQAPTHLDTGHLPAEARQMLRDFFASRRHTATAPTNPTNRTTRYTHTTTTRTNRATAPNRTRTTTRTQRTYGTTPDGTITQRTTRRPGHIVNRGTLNRNVLDRNTTNRGTFKRSTAQRSRTTGPNHTQRRTLRTTRHNALAWAEDPFLRDEVIRAIGEYLKQQNQQQNQQSRFQHLRTSTVDRGPAS